MNELIAEGRQDAGAVMGLAGVRQALEQQMHAVLPQWSLAPVVEGLMALRGVSLVSAMMILAELGDISRFDSPRQLMA